MRKRKWTAFFLALLLALGNILPSMVIADTISKEAKACETLGILKGSNLNEGVTSEYLATTPSRLTALIIFLRIKGLEGEALTYYGENNFTDAKDLEWVVGRNYLAYAKDNPQLGWIGSNDGKFYPNNPIDAKAFYKVMLETLGYKQDLDFTYADTLKFAQSISLISSASSMEKKTNFTVDDVAKAIYNTLNTKPKGKNKKLITLMTEEGILDEDKVVKAGFKLDIIPVEVLSFETVSNNRLVLELEQALNISEDDIVIYSESTGKQITVTDAALIGNKVYITTAEVTPFTVYELSIDMDIPINGMAVKNYSVRYVALPKDTQRPKADVEVLSNNTIRVTFNEEVQRADAEDITNYTIKNNLPIYSATLDSSGKIVTLTTAPQKEGDYYWIEIQGIRDLSGNVMEPFERRIVGMARDSIRPYIKQVIVESNKSVILYFSEPLNKITAERIENYIIEGNVLTIEDAMLDEKENSVILITSEQKPNTIYRITVRNIADLADNVMSDTPISFRGATTDTSKVTISAVAISNNELEITFNRKLDKESAESIENYYIDNDLEIINAVLHGNDKVVTLVTENQTPGTVYRLEISNLKDISGNMIDYHSTYFVGKPKDTTPLTYTVRSGKDSIIITFNKKVDKKTAEDVFNYELDSSLGYAAKATLDTDDTGRIVTLLTKPQQSGKQYSITVRNVKDLAGNTISKDDKVAKKYFIGFGDSDSGDLNLLAINASDMSTIDMFFDKELTDDELKALEVSILTEDGYAYESPKGLEYKKYFLANKSTVRAQFRTGDSSNPEIFKSGRIYEIRVSNIDRLYESNNSNIKLTSGISLKNEAPYITDVYAVNSTAIEVTFSEPVKGISPSQFTINGIKIADASVTSDEITTKATLYLNSSTPLKDNTEYKLYAKSGIKDAAGYNSIDISGSRAYYEFEGTSIKNEAPQVEDVNVLDQYTVAVTFDEPVKLPSSSSGFTIRRTSSGGPSIVVSQVVLSEDKTTATIYLNSSNGALSEDYEYTMTISSSITDLQGLAIDSNSRTLKFYGSDVEITPFEIMTYSVSSDNKTITLITSKPIKNTNISMDCFQISGAYYSKSSSDYVEVNDKTIRINLRNALAKNDTVKIKLTDTGKSTIKDLNNQKLDMNELEIPTN